IVNLAIAVLAVDFALMPWSSASFAGAVVALAVWGACGWGLVVAQQHRLVGIAPALAPILLALNAAAIYLAVWPWAAGAALATGGPPPRLPLLSTILIVAGIACAELAHRLSRRAAVAPAARIVG